MLIQEFTHFNQLLDYYGSLLTEVQRDIVVDYYCHNLSLSEISENRSISRAAVSDALNTGKNKLNEYENKLGLLAKRTKFEEIYQKHYEKLDKETQKILETLKEVI
ncbi:MAG: sigma factor-like helix-turn-helix DNA-binding protein [Bacilli bacterium]|jgi:predicted DNA-binding protein YlxM (UPF0122 family)